MVHPLTFDPIQIMITLRTSLTSRATAARSVAAGLLLTVMATSASAALFTLNGEVSFGPLTGASITGSFAYDEPLGGGYAEAPLSKFILDFMGQTYTLALPNASGQAWVSDGVFAGFQYVLNADEAHPDVGISLLSGDAIFGPWSEGYFAFTTNPLDDIQAQTSWGAFTVSPSAVPEPGQLALLLAAGAAAMVASGRWRV